MKNGQYAIVKVNVEIIDTASGNSVVYHEKYNGIVKTDDVNSIQKSVEELKDKLGAKTETTTSQPNVWNILWNKLRNFSKESSQSYYNLLNG